MGFSVLPSKANFVFVMHPALDGGELYAKLKERGILVRHFEKAAIRQYNRVTIGTEAEMEAYLQAVSEIIKEARACE